MSTANKRTPFQIERDRLEIAQMYLRGKTQHEIATALVSPERGYILSQQMISYDLRAVQVQWQKSTLVNIDEIKGRELARVDTLELEYWEAWERSKLNAEVRITRQRGKRAKDDKAIPEEVERTERTEGRTGNPAFLNGVQWCIEQRCKIFGLYAPEKINLDWRKEAETKGIDAGELFNKIVAEYVAVLKERG